MSSDTVLALVALVVAVVAAVGAVGAWLASNRSAVASDASANEAKRANYLAGRPDVSLTTDGTVHRGVEVVLMTDRDLDSLRVELLREPSQMYDRHRYLRMTQLLMDATLVNRAYDDGQRTVIVSNVRAGQKYWISIQFTKSEGHLARADFRLTATVGDDEWVLNRGFTDVELQFIT